MRREQGFTLMEVLLAIALFGLIAAVMYGAVSISGEGFYQLQQKRDQLEGEQWLGRQFRLDVTYMQSSHKDEWKPLLLSSDPRGASSFDQLQLLVQEPGNAGLVRVHYFIDENTMELKRESILAQARYGVEPVEWSMGKVHSFDVDVQDAEGRWLQQWDGKAQLNKRLQQLRIRVQDETRLREWYIPLRAS